MVAVFHKKKVENVCQLDATGGTPCVSCAFSNRAKPGQWSDEGRLFLLNRQTDRWESMPDTASSPGSGKVVPCETGVFFC